MMKDLSEYYLPKRFVCVGPKRNVTHKITLKYTRAYNFIPLVEERAKGNNLMFSSFNTIGLSISMSKTNIWKYGYSHYLTIKLKLRKSACICINCSLKLN